MDEVNLEQLRELSYLDLVALADAAKRIVNIRKRNIRAQFRAKALALAKEYGFTREEAAEIIAIHPREKGGFIEQVKSFKTPAQAKYANPDNPSETWSGKGKRPSWYNRKIEQNVLPDDMLIFRNGEDVQHSV